eukprot:gene4052-biopygen2909
MAERLAALQAEQSRAAQELERRKVLLAEERQRAELERELLVEQEELIRDELDDRSVIREEERDQRRLIRLTASQEALQKTAEALASRSTAATEEDAALRVHEAEALAEERLRGAREAAEKEMAERLVALQAEQSRAAQELERRKVLLLRSGSALSWSASCWWSRRNSSATSWTTAP